MSTERGTAEVALAKYQTTSVFGASPVGLPSGLGKPVKLQFEFGASEPLLTAHGGGENGVNGKKVE